MSKIAIVIDSTITLPNELIQKHHLHVAPQLLIWGEETFQDQIDITPSAFYTRLATDKIHPSTSQVTPLTFTNMFRDLTDSGYDVLALLISSNLSGTVDSALQAQAALPGRNIAVIDTRFTSLATGFIALQVVRAAESGATLQQCVELAEKAIPSLGVYFLVDTLKYLHKGGRIGGAAAFVGTALDLKPILKLEAGRIEAAGKVRTKSKANEKMLELIDADINGRTPIRFGILHAQAEAEANALMDRLLLKYNVAEHYICELSPVLGVHTGPGTIGVAFMAGM